MAGMFLAMASFKPQLIYLLWIALILWTVVNKKWQLLISTISTIAILTTIPLNINPNVLSQYLYSIREYPFSEWATPTIGSLLRLIFGLDKFWLQFIPMGIGTVIFTYFWLKEKERWNWIDGSPMIVGFSILTTPYAWTYDAILFIIPIVHASIYAINHHSKNIQLVIFSVLLILSLFNLILHMQLNDFWFLWLFPSIFLWYGITKKASRNKFIE
jgi:hypothetical protein